MDRQKIIKIKIGDLYDMIAANCQHLLNHPEFSERGECLAILKKHAKCCADDCPVLGDIMLYFEIKDDETKEANK